jgi:cell division FtsZ-interacting protein ZapD
MSDERNQKQTRRTKMKNININETVVVAANGNVTFFRVLDVLNKVALVQKLQNKIEYSEKDFSAGKVYPSIVPDFEDAFLANIKRNGIEISSKRLNGYNFKEVSYIAKIWDKEMIGFESYTKEF